jgi:aminoglycoside phosphotransferase (APT) family kinase protein
MMRRVSTDARPVRATEQLDWPRVAAFLRQHLPIDQIPGLDLSCEMEVEQFYGGHSNLTYLVRYADVELVLRRPPFGPLPPTAHDVTREYHWLAAMNPVFPLAPKPYALCEDIGVAGAPFYVMERRRGVVVRTEEPPSLMERPDARRRVSAALVDTLAALHGIDIERNGLVHLGKPRGFVERQVRGWTERWHRSKTDDVPEMDAMVRWLPAHLPPEPEYPSVVHGDFKLDNVMLDTSDVGRLIAVFDWEMSALGDPLVDLGILLAYWSNGTRLEPNDALATVTGRPGWFTRDEVIARYAEKSGRDLSRLPFYEAFALFKIAVVIQQIFYRYRQGQTDDQRFAQFGTRVIHLARQAAAAADRV